MLREKLRNRKGFTLIEIIVVIVILAVLMAVAVPSVMSYMNEGSKARYDTIGRSVLINAQTEYAKEVAEGNYSDDNLKNAVEAKNYGDSVEVTVSKIDLTTKGTEDKDRDVQSVECLIKIDDATKNVTIDANKKVTVS